MSNLFRRGEEIATELYEFNHHKASQYVRELMNNLEWAYSNDLLAELLLEKYREDLAHAQDALKDIYNELYDVSMSESRTLTRIALRLERYFKEEIDDLARRR